MVKVILLGSGTSSGVPAIGCSCKVCTSKDIKNQRTRASLYLEKDGYSLLIDTATELRLQFLRQGILKLDGVLYTHDHADHLHGIDDLRPFCYEKPLNIFGTSSVMKEIQERFSYIFKETQKGGGKPRLILNSLDMDTVELGPFHIRPIEIFHGKLKILGYRIDNVAYLTDCSFIPQESYSYLKDLDLLILGGLRYKPHETHFSVDQALKEIKKIRPREAWLTHLNHDLDYLELTRYLPAGVKAGFDGLSWEKS